jgi:hypothetical protein
MEEDKDEVEAVAANIKVVADVPEDEDPFESVYESKLDP